MKDLSVTQKRCLELARVIRDGSSGLRFNMHLYADGCGTAGCIAGHAIFLYDKKRWKRANQLQFDGGMALAWAARDLLGLSSSQMSTLFFDYSHTPETAAATLEALAMEKVDAI